MIDIANQSRTNNQVQASGVPVFVRRPTAALATLILLAFGLSLSATQHWP